MKFDANALIAEQIEAIRRAVPTKAIIACSGGVDSTTAAVLASRALGDRLLGGYIDTGPMRRGETDAGAQTPKELNGRHRIVQAAGGIFSALKGIVGPAAKRKGSGRS